MHWAPCEEAQGHLGHAQGLSTHVVPLRAKSSVIEWLAAQAAIWAATALVTCHHSLQAVLMRPAFDKVASWPTSDIQSITDSWTLENLRGKSGAITITISSL